ncbi:MAG: AI-2E family transporter [Actinomycetota bacterium]|nr:AI-2E family transporter [Actinomycetota bacterium]
MNGHVTDRGLLHAALALALALFALFLAWHFLAGIATAVLVLLVGLLLAVALSGPVEALHQRKVPRIVASVAIILSILAVFGLGGYLFVPVLTEQIWQLVSTLPFAFSQLGTWAERLGDRTGLPFGDGEGPSLSTLASWGRRILGGALGLFGSLTTLAFGLVVAIFVPLYLTAMPEPVVNWTLRLLPPNHKPRAREVLSIIRASLLRWLKGRLLSMTMVGVLWTGALYLIGIPGALFLGILAGLLEFVPYVGPVISTVPPVVLALAGDPTDVLWVLLSYLLIQQVEGFLLTPLIEGRVASLHPAVVIITVTLAGAAFGFLGVLLAVPTTLVVKVLVEECWFRRLEAPEEAA